MSSSTETNEQAKKESHKKEQVQPKFTEKAYYVITNRECLTALLSVFLVQAAYSSIEPHLVQILHRDLNLNTSLVGMVLMITSFGYMAASPIAGKLSESVGFQTVLFSGVGLCGIGLFFLIPFPHTDLLSSLSTTHLRLGFGIFGLILISASQGMAFVPALPAMVEGIMRNKNHEEEELDRMEQGVSNRARDKQTNNQPTLLGSREEAACFLGGFFQAICQLAATIGPVMGQGLLSFLGYGSVEILLGCALLISAVVLFYQAQSNSVYEDKSEPSECMENSDAVATVDNSSPLDQADCGRLTSPILNRRPSSLYFGLSPDNDKDSGEQMHEFGSLMVIGKDVDPG